MLTLTGDRVKATLGVLNPILPIAATGALGASALFTAARSLRWPLVWDAVWLHYMAWRMLSGAIPYRDFFDTNLPGIYFIHMAIQLWIGPDDLSFYLFNLFWLALAVIALALFCRPFGRWAAVIAPTLFAAYYLSTDQIFMGQRDFLICPLLILAGHAVARSLERRSHPGRLFFGGLAIGASLTIKPYPLIWLGLLAAILAAFQWHRRTQPLASIVSLVAGAALPPALVGVWLAANGALGPFWQIFGVYLLKYYGDLERMGRRLLLLEMLRTLGPLAPVAPLLAYVVWRARDRLAPRYTILGAGLLYGAAHFVLQGKGWTYHAFPLMYVAAAVVAALLAPLLSARAEGQLQLAAGAVLLFLAFSFGYPCLKNGRQPSAVATTQPLGSKLLADLPRYNLAPGETVQVLDTNLGGFQALYRLRIAMPTRYYYDYPLFWHPEATLVQAMRREFLADLAAHSPRLIVVFYQSLIPPLDMSRLDGFPEFVTFLNEHYRADRVVEQGYTIYARR
jgi:hypothetical protein